MNNHTPKTDKLLRAIGDPLNSDNPRTLLCKSLERDLKRMSVWNAELLEALEQLHNAVENDDGTLDAALRRAGKHIDEIKGIVPDVREITLHTDAVNRPLLDMSRVKTQPNEQILFRETSY